MLTEVKYGKHISGEIIDFTQNECGGCGIPFYVPTKWFDSRIKNKGKYSCPNGCNRVFIGKTETDVLQEKLDALKKQKDKEREELQNKLLDTMCEKMKLEKQLKRIHKGVCPCCNRSFQNLKRHIETKHPELKIK